MRNITFIISVVALAFSVIATCIAAYRTPVLSFDYQGVIVGMLSALVTVLVGWQIFMAINFKREMNEVRGYADERTRKSSDAAISSVRAYSMFLLAEDENRKGNIESAINGYVSAIEHAARGCDFEPARAALFSLGNMVTYHTARGMRGRVYKSETARYISALYSTFKDAEYKELLERVISFIENSYGI